jgi:subtilisin-like proprotein convertase family protein
MWAAGESALDINLLKLNSDDPCQGSNDFILETYSAECETLHVAQCLDPGTYFLGVSGGAQLFEPGPCNQHYVLNIECQSECPPCPCAPNDSTWCFNSGSLDNNGQVDDYDNYFHFTIPDNFTITDVNACISAGSFSDLGYVSMELESPAGTWVTLFYDDELNGYNLDCTQFDDEASISIDGGNTPYTGSFRPQDNLSTFDGENAQGEWTLYVYDGDNDSAVIDHICLTFESDHILPVELNNFTAVPGDKQVTLNWSTASDVNNASFEIKRDGELMARLDGAGTSSSAHNYTWTDTNLNNGHEYSYELVSVDMSGARASVSTVNATPQVGAGTVKEYALHQNYPNPFNPTTTINYDLVEAQHVVLKVFNPLGQTVATLVNGNVTAGRHSIDFDASHLSSGLYFYAIEAGNFHAVHKMILMK